MSDFQKPRILLCGDTGISVEFGDEIDPGINRRVQQLFRRLKLRQTGGVLGLNPTYRSLFVQYDPWLCSFENLLLTVEECLGPGENDAVGFSEVIEVPVCYGGEYGPDLEEVASFHKMSPEEVARLHYTPLYHVYMIGFTPGFPYLGGLDERLHTPRKQTPRRLVPAGSVGIADRQTGIYPIDSPGGWQLIGRTPMRVFDIRKTDPFTIHCGNSVKFRPITKEEFEQYQDS
jgi:KipI family sensor histidine kinase inhibitor